MDQRWTDGWTNGWTDKADELCIHIWKSFSSFSFSSSGVYTVLDLLEIIANNAGFQYNCGWEGRGIQHPPFTLHLHTHFIQSQPQHPNCISSHFSTQARVLDIFYVCLCMEWGLGCGWGLDAPAHPSAPILWPRITCSLEQYYSLRCDFAKDAWSWHKTKVLCHNGPILGVFTHHKPDTTTRLDFFGCFRSLVYHWDLIIWLNHLTKSMIW